MCYDPSALSRNIQNLQPRTLPASQGKVRVHNPPARPVQRRYPVPDPEGSPQWLLRLAETTCVVTTTGGLTAGRVGQAVLAGK